MSACRIHVRLLFCTLLSSCFLLLARTPLAAAQGCPPHSHPFREEEQGGTVKVHCRCDDGYVNRDNRCVTLVEAENREFSEHFQAWLSKVEEGIRQDRERDRSWVGGLHNSVRTLRPPHVTFADLRPGDVLLLAPADLVSDIIDLLSGRHGASHAVTVLARTPAGMLFLDHTGFNPLDPSRGGGSHVIGETEFRQQYGERHLQVARALDPVDGRELLAMALRYAKNDSRPGGWKSFRPTSFSIVGRKENNAACSVRAAMVVFRATGQSPEEVVKRLSGLGIVDLSPNSFFDKNGIGKYFSTFPFARH